MVANIFGDVCENFHISPRDRMRCHQFGTTGMNVQEPAHSTNEPYGASSGGPVETPADMLEDVQVEPLSLPMLGKFFGVPFLIISLIVGGAVCVVLLFGGPAAAPHRSVCALLQSLEANSGERSMGLLLTQEKALWQTALELSNRLEHKDKELTPEELREVADRVTKLLRVDLAHLDIIKSVGDDHVRQANLRSRAWCSSSGLWGGPSCQVR